MTDNETITALECCITDGIRDCKKCPFNYRDECGELKKRALDLINRQKTEIERLPKSYSDVAFEQYNNGFTEGVEIFAERLKKHIETYTADEEASALYLIEKIKDIAGKMVGDNDER
jgi:hypothetical protein